MTVALITLIGFLVKLPIVNLPMRLGDAIFSRLPLIKSIYTGIKDIMEFMTSSREDSGQGKAVLVELPGGLQVVGLVTDAAPILLPTMRVARTAKSSSISHRSRWAAIPC
ncbi:MAG: DUF502 domain-containing protein [Gammaproteobacteria bacterium]|nr:DUF502 domain-containing protein [Gammaproteobacteria bacterium]